MTMRSAPGALLACAVLGLSTAAAAAGGPQPVAGAAQPFRIGAWQAFALRDAVFVEANDAKTFGVDVGPVAVANVLQAAGAPTDAITLGVDALLVKAPGRVMLFDTGLGPKAHGALPESLAEAGVAPGAVTDVMITHTHGDHVGGLATADGRLAFPNATIRMSAEEWTWMRRQPGAKALTAIIAPKVVTFEAGQAVVPGVLSVSSPGHTPGHVGYEIGSGTTRLLDIGDTAHSAIVSLAEPDWIMGFDHDAAAGKISRRVMLSRLARSGERVFAPHFPFPGVGRIVAVGDHFVWRPDLP